MCAPHPLPGGGYYAFCLHSASSFFPVLSPDFWVFSLHTRKVSLEVGQVLVFLAKMPASGVFWYDCARSVGPAPKIQHWKGALPEFIPATGRAKMGPRPAPFQHKINAEARRHRDLRNDAPVAYAAIKSQLLVARKRLRKHIENPAKQAILDRFPTRNTSIQAGDDVSFIRPGPRRHAVPGRGEVLCFPDKTKRFVAIDRSAYLHRSRLLLNIDVVPVVDAWK